MKYQAGDIVVQCATRAYINKYLGPYGPIPGPNGQEMTVIDLSMYDNLQQQMKNVGAMRSKGDAAVIRYDDGMRFIVHSSTLQPMSRCNDCIHRLRRITGGGCGFDTFAPQPGMPNKQYVPTSRLSVMPFASKEMKRRLLQKARLRRKALKKKRQRQERRLQNRIRRRKNR